MITNPSSGNLRGTRRREILSCAQEILQADLHGLDTTSKEQFLACARDLAGKCDVLVVAGGDGSLSDVINAINTRERPIAYIPLGSGNAMSYALHLRGGVAEAATRIKEGTIRNFDLIQCDGRRSAFMVSIGLEGAVIRKRDEYKARGASGFKPYLIAFLVTYLKDYTGVKARIALNGHAFETRSLLSLMIMKQPYYGYGLKVMPGARLGDGRLHVRLLHKRVIPALVGGITSLTLGNRAGLYQTAERVSVALEAPGIMQADGDVAWEAKEFHFKILPGALKMKV
jgi:diacylglycerol kinase family enzyme